MRSPSNHLRAVPSCLMGALLPPVRLTCLPFAYTPAAKNGSDSGKMDQSARRGQGLLDPAVFPSLSVTEAGKVEVVGMEGLGGGMEGAWAVSTRVLAIPRRSFLLPA